MKVTGSSIEQLEKGKPRGKCRKWRLWASTDHGRKSRRFAGTWTQAVEALSAFVDELAALVPNDQSFGSYAASWLAFRRSNGEISPGTLRGYSTSVNAIAASPLGSMRMDEVDPEACRDALMWIRTHPLRGDKCELTGTTMRMRYAVLKMICDQAVADGRLAADPMRSIARPGLDTEERAALTEEELAVFLARLSTLPLDGRSMAVYLMAYLGLRRAEACAVAVDGIGSGYVTISRTIVESTGAFGPTKNRIVRTLPVPPQLAEKVDEWMVIRDALGFDAPTLCCNTFGGILRPTALADWWEGVREPLGYPGFVFHQLRHTNLTIMARHMSPFDLQRYAGWKSLAMAMRYVHDNLDAVTSAVQGYWCSTDAPNVHQAPGGELKPSA